MSADLPPIIIKKVKKGGHGHHGGAWKVAFADFVTAMMAFFMLMWLLGSTTPEQKAAISHYMNNPLAESGPGGGGANRIISGGAGILASDPISVQTSTANEKREILAEQVEQKTMEEMHDDLQTAIETNKKLQAYKDQLLLSMTKEGLRIEIVDQQSRAMFAPGHATLEHHMTEILSELAKTINQAPNHIAISGHTDRTPFAGKNGYSNWELSADRANAARRTLVAAGVKEEKIGRVVGLASTVLFDKNNPYSPTNRRISILVMNQAAEKAQRQLEGSPTERQQEEKFTPIPELLPQHSSNLKRVEPS